MKILSVIGGRPQIFKIDKSLKQVIVNTGQHYDDEMAGRHFRDTKLKPKYNLNCDSEQMGLMIDKIRNVLRREKPDIVLVYGDTYSTLAGSIASSLENITLAHVEAGLRSHDKSMPEETNRIVADVLATYRFAPTHTAMRNLMEEGLGDNTFHVGDSLFWSMKKLLPLKKTDDFGTYIYASIHRRENLAPDNLREILNGLGTQKVFFPMHPHTRRVIKKSRLKVPKNIEVVKPLPRKESLERMFNSRFIVTDSGGILREAYWMLRYSVIIRTVTEWPEIVDGGWGQLVPPVAERIARAMEGEHRVIAKVELPYINPYHEIKRVLNV